MTKMQETILKAAAGAMAGAVIGWGANALTLGGRVTAIEQALMRIEARMDAQKAVKP